MGEQELPYESLLDEATAWVVRLRSDRVSPADKRRFSQWLNLSRHHEQAFDEVAETWETLGAAAYLSLDTGTVAQKSPASFFEFRWFTNLGGLPAGIAMATVAALVVLAYSLSTIAPETTTYTNTFATATGQQRAVTLPDGSVVQLNTKSTIEVIYTDQQRKLALLSGEAYFEVAPNKQRPFIVSVHQGTVEAVGTAFNIYVKDKETVVSVTEGVVNVREKRDASSPTPRSTRVAVAQQVSLDKRGIGQVAGSNLEKAVAWRQNTLIFDDMLLPDAIAELNRYLQEPVVAEDASLAKLRVSGTFSLEAPEATLQALVTSFNLTTERSVPRGPLYLRFE
ncbi:FecR family protein [Exilibacterium tricleocarpae]|uniref:FecR family protein n=1 Tax=Exilibacterium tricleocarpae TaxID=2591008 RepID=A0A545U3Q3_9GAMM|nr:FecR family protein [Exilibacterium tricleocarpae]TQV84099.1 FecR family protein [Exilibacterium tricleocarpae]